MKIYINTSPLTSGHAGRGIGQYTRLLIQAVRQHTDLTLVDSEQEADVVHYPFFDLFFLTLPFSKPRPTVVTVHDVIPLLYPEQYPKGVRGTIKQMIQTLSLNGAKEIVTDSDCSTKDVIHFLRQPKTKVQTVYLAPDSHYGPATKDQIASVMQKYDLQKPYFLYVGDINYNKNLPGLLKAFVPFKERFLLVLVSRALRRDNQAAQFLWQEIDTLGIESSLRILTNVPLEPLEEMRSLYTGAFWYIQPSFYEGFGLPVLEAQACGCPVVSSRGGSLAKISQESSVDFDRLSSINEIQRDEYIQRGFDNVSRFSWQKTAEMMMKVYLTCAE